MVDKIRIRDKRKGVFTVDNVVLNHYGKMMGSTGIALYVTLCRFSNNQTQQCYPSIRKIREETGMHQDTIIEVAERLIRLKLIRKRVEKGKYTIYTLLEPIEDSEKKDKLLKEYIRWSEISTGRKLGKVWSDIDTGGRKLGNKRTKSNELRKRTKTLSKDNGQKPKVKSQSYLIINKYLDLIRKIFELDCLDGTNQQNRRFAYNTLRKLKKKAIPPADFVKWAKKSNFNITSAADLFYKVEKITKSHQRDKFDDEEFAEWDLEGNRIK